LRDTNRCSTREFHISRAARDLYRFDESLFTLSGNVIFANFHAARVFAAKINEKRDLIRYPETAVRSGQINAMGLIDEILHYVVKLYQRETRASIMAEALRFVQEKLGGDAVGRTLQRFVDEFPPLSVYRGETDAQSWLSSASGGVSHREVALEELLLLWLDNRNPAFSPYDELFNDGDLEKATEYRQVIAALSDFFSLQPAFGPDDQNLIEMLRSPAVAHPHSFTDQLEYIRRKWGFLLGDFLFRLLGSLDLVREENKLSFLGAGPSRVVDFRGLELQAERFSPDQDWMPRVVMIAKNAYVWLDQLSKRLGAELKRLDQVPDEELDRLASWGFTGLWLIGLWERSSASKRIKQMCGNPEAEASAYSLMSYDIAPDLGGWEAFTNLKERAWKRGIRMAGDMVPNHMGIDSRWVMEHPDWFVSLPHSPFPSYTFSGPNLSWQEGVGIFLEDHYYSRSDAAVVFRRSDAGGDRFIYHGNDGTSMPWNDTAQLDFLKPEVREAVIQTILHVARSFPIIRFDAAMTLTKKHYQRLWFPEPGTGGDIPSRADHGMDRRRFDELMPSEFWREVVDRVAQEAPDTLLLAEAFWLLEGYFVRTLGMHRVYNSAFMNMLKNEENAQYRQVIKNTLEFNPEILKRFVNFMNNPDEETAVAQFGNGDKYFGVCLMMITLPGLPMFGHGQVEGLTEKYGMEYRRAYWDEQPDEQLIRRQEREVFPLVHRRTLFAEVQHFLLYDLFTPEGSVNEDVFAYSNRRGQERALVVYHNRYAEARGWIRASTAVATAGGDGRGRSLQQFSLGEGLALSRDPGLYCVFRDQVSGREYLRSCGQLHEEGLYVELHAYHAQVFVEFREVRDDPRHPYAQLEDYLNGRGVPSVEEALREVVMQPVHVPFRALANAELFSRVSGESPQRLSDLLQELRPKFESLSSVVKEFSGGSGEAQTLSRELERKLAACVQLPFLKTGKKTERVRLPSRVFRDRKADHPQWQSFEFAWATLLSWLMVHALGRIVDSKEYAQQSRSWIDEWLLGKILLSAVQKLGLSEADAWRCLPLVKILTSHQRWFEAEDGQPPTPHRILVRLLADREVQEYLQVNRYQGVLWYNGQSFEQLLAGLRVIAAVDVLAEARQDKEAVLRILVDRAGLLNSIEEAGRRAEYRVESLLELTMDRSSPGRRRGESRQ
jgi:glycosidase